MNGQPTHDGKRSWRQFSLRSLVLLLSVAAVVCGHVAYERRKAAHEREAYLAIDALNGSVTRSEAKSKRPPWLKFILGDDSYSFVESVNLSGDPSEGVSDPRNPTAERIAPIRHLTRVQELDLTGIALRNDSLMPVRSFYKLETLSLTRCPLITDEGLRPLDGHKSLKRLTLTDMEGLGDRGMGYLASLPSLEHLDLSGTSVGDGGLKHVAQNRQIIRLLLRDTKVSRAGMRFVGQLSKLQVLALLNAPIGDAGFEHLKNLAELEVLDLYGTAITDRSLPFIGRMKKLRSLELGTAVAETTSPAARRSFAPISPDASPSRITDEGARHLADLINLESLDLSNSQITSGGLSHLRKMKKLDTLDLTGTAVTDEGLVYLEQLRKLNLLFAEATSVTEEGARNLARKLDNVHISITKDGRHRNVGKNY